MTPEQEQALIDVAKAAYKVFQAYGLHPGMTGCCITDHYWDKQCDCGYTQMGRALVAARAAVPELR